MNKLNLRKLQHIAGLALQNGIRLHFDSIVLLKNKSYPSALFLSVIAMEEI
jgi:AbiV family abortive infection protein